MEPRPIEKFAIIGLGCRMPPNAGSLANFWRFLLRGGNALRPIREDRWDWRQFFDADPRRPGKTYAPKAASLDADHRQFDPLAFGMSPREAASLDPQQRLLLEVTWEAFEDAGIPLERISGSATGVFIGGFCLDHLVLQTQPSNRHLTNAHSPGGVMMTVLSNRLSHAFNLRGPSLTLDTACSSSLVALHYACQSLRLRESDMVLAGGVNVMTRPEFPIIMSKGHFLSDHGECRAFDESAAGYARGEGAGVFLLKRYDEAVAAGDVIHAVIRGTGVNQDGHTDGISLPNSAAQAELLRDVYRRAGVAPGEVDYVEAHGTGTQAGDPAELRALDANFATGRAPGRKLLVGSVKTNVGHLEAAAGVAGMLKAIGVLKAREVPGNLHFKRPNPKIPFADFCLQVPTETTELPSSAEKPTLFVAVNSFGYGGTNAHILLESAPVGQTVETPAEVADAPRLIPFSARSEEALRDLAGKLAFQLGAGFSGSLTDLAYTTAFRRSHLSVRGVAVAGNLEELREQLIAASTGQPHQGVVLAAKGAPPATAPVFVYTGMGPQWWGMGQELLRSDPLVAATVAEIDAIFAPLAGWSLAEAMRADEAHSRMARTEVAQPANFALQVALTRWWAARGVRPAAVVGHSVGEVTAAFVAGVYSLEEAVRVSFHRSRLQQSAAGRGSMLAVGLAETEAETLIARSPGVSIAAINSFSAVTLSGDTGQLEQLAADLATRGVFHKFLRVEVAYHSPQMDPLRAELLEVLADLAPRPEQLPLYSTAFGRAVPAAAWDAKYWWRNVREPVRFASAMQAILDEGFSAFLEIGPHPVLGNSIKECAAHLERKVTGFASLRRQEPEAARLRLTLAELYCGRAEIDWRALSPAAGNFWAGPAYSWQRQTHWVESERSKMERLGLPGAVYLNRTVLAPRPTWEVEINRNYFPFLFDHRVQDQTVFAGMGYVEAALALSAEVHGRAAVVLANVSFERVLIVDSAKLQYLVTEFDVEGGRFSISSRIEGEESGGQRHCRGRLVPQSDPRPERLDLAALRAECGDAVTIDAFHERLERRQLFYGPAFRPVLDVRVGADCFLVKIDASRSAGEEFHPLHPTVFDAALRGVLYCASGERLFVPFSFEEFAYFSRPASAECHAFGRLISQTDSRILADVWLTDEAGNVHAHARRMALQAIDMAPPTEATDLFYEVTWREAERAPEGKLNDEEIVILADAEDSDDELAQALAERLPTARFVRREANVPPGFGRQEMAAVFGAIPTGRHVIVLWGSGAASFDESALPEKCVGLLQALAAEPGLVRHVTFVTRGAQVVTPGESISNLAASTLGALGLVAQNESDAIVCRSIDLEPGDSAANAVRILNEIAGAHQGDNAYRGGRRFEKVLGPRTGDARRAEQFAATLLEEPVELRSAGAGRLGAVRFERAERRAPEEGEIEMRVHRAALNDKDLLKIEGRISPLAMQDTFWGAELGMEAAGVVARSGAGTRFAPGDRVVAILPRAFRSWVTIPETFVVRIPEGFGFEAAGIPVAYLVAFRGLVEIAQLQRGERVLIHHGSGGVGLAAIDVARWRGAEIFATAGSEQKRQRLRDLGVVHVYSSRELDFGRQIRADTDQQGVDVIIGAQSGQAMHVGLGLLRSGGRYIEVGQQDIADDLDLPLRAFHRNVLFAAVDVDRLARERPALIRQSLETIFGHVVNGDFQPGTPLTFSARDFREAFGAMSRCEHFGKHLLDFSTGEVDTLARPVVSPLVRRDGTYVVTGGTSGFGLSTARWLAEQGAGRLVLVSRSGGNAPGIRDAVEKLSGLGGEVEVRSVDMADAAQVRNLVGGAGTAACPLRGIVHGAMVLADAMLADLTEESFRRVFRPKAAGAIHVAAAIEGLATLDFVAFYSSVSALIGNRGQASYVVANALQDGLAVALRARGVPAVSIQWGALAESGVVARDERLVGALSAAGITGLRDREAIDALGLVLARSEAQVGIFKLDWNRWLEAHPRLADDPRFARLRRNVGDVAGSGAAAQIRGALGEASREQRLRALEDHLREVVSAILKMAKDGVAADRKLSEMGVDSLMVLELGLGLEERLGVKFSAMELLKGPTVQQLATVALEKLWCPTSPGAPRIAANPLIND